MLTGAWGTPSLHQLWRQCSPAGGFRRGRVRGIRSELDAPSTLSRALGVDYGRRGVGLAVSTLGLAPRPLLTLDPMKFGSLLELAKEVVEVARAEGCHGLVVGLPVTATGNLRQQSTDSQQGRRCRNFAGNVSALATQHGLPVYLVDESMTTIGAESFMMASGKKRGGSGKTNKDSVAAALILAKYYDDPGDAVFVQPLSF